HRRLLECVRLEREALLSADLKSIQENTYAKQALISQVHQQETARIQLTRLVAARLRQDPEDLTPQKIIVALQGSDLKSAEKLRAGLSTLTLLIKRIREQNSDSRSLVEKSLVHVA